MEVSAMVFAAGLVMTVLTIDRYFLGGSGSDSKLPDFLKDIDQRIGHWMIWIAFLGILVVLTGGWYFQDMIRKRREFRRLLDTDSKAKFIQNQKRVEELAYWYLGREYLRKVEEKKREFAIR
jgi:aspartokinase-like uncharacterized kinase